MAKKCSTFNDVNCYGIILRNGRIDNLKQRKRPGENQGLGYYTSWEKTKENGCIYCGRVAETREHVPSKTFLNEPYPDNLPTIPACYECNNGYSKDEKYISCFLDVLKSYVYIDYELKNSTITRLQEDIGLKKMIREQIFIKDDKAYFSVDDNKIKRILTKLARGHAGFELDYVKFDDVGIDVKYNFLFNLSKDYIKTFNNDSTYSLAPEVGSRGTYLIQNLDLSDAKMVAMWNIVQNEQYRYQVLYNKSNIIVKIVIFEFLYCEVYFN